MKIPGEDTRFLVLNMKASSLYALIADGKHLPTSLGHEWKTLIGFQASLQPNCNREGFNVISDNPAFSKGIIGYTWNQEHDCVTGDSRIGFATGGHQRDSDTWETRPRTPQTTEINTFRPWDTSGFSKDN